MKEYKSMLQALREFEGQNFNGYGVYDYKRAHERERSKICGESCCYHGAIYRSNRDASDTYVPTLTTFVKNGGVEIVERKTVLTNKAVDALNTIKDILGYNAFEEARAKMMKPCRGYTKKKVVYGKVLTPEQFIEKKTQEFNEYLKSL